MKSDAHVLLEIHLKELGLRFVAEHKFHPKRRWRFDYLIGKPELNYWKHAVEIEGGIWSRGRHTRGVGYLGDIEKYNSAAIMGFAVLRFSTAQVLDGTAREFIAEHVARGGSSGYTNFTNRSS